MKTKLPLKDEISLLEKESTVILQLKNNPWEMMIRIHGPLANIPGLKNAKMPGKNFLNPLVTGKLAALSRLYFRALSGVPENLRPPVFKGEYLWLTVILSDSSKIDEDNGMASIKDWLEPIVTPKRKRKFGIGLIENDRFVNGVIIKPKIIGAQSTFGTTIKIQLMKDMSENVRNFIGC